MYRTTGGLVLTFLGFGINVFAQNLSHQVLVPVAGIISTGTVNYSQTIGEPVVEIIGGSDYILTQGFQQPSMLPASEIAPEGNGVDVFPNPATDYIKIKFYGDEARKFQVDILTLTGTIISTETINFNDKYFYTREINVERFVKGIYFIRIVSQDGLIKRTFKIDKM